MCGLGGVTAEMVEPVACVMLNHMGAPCRLLLEPPHSWDCQPLNCSWVGHQHDLHVNQ